MSNIEAIDHDPETGEIYEGPSRLPAKLSSQDLSAVYSSEINQQIATARAYPRRKDKIIAQEIIERATLNQEIATECFYRLKRTSRGAEQAKDIQGESVRFAEIVQASYGNTRVATDYVGVEYLKNGAAFILVTAAAMDVQTNNIIRQTVSRSITTSARNGPPRLFSNDMIGVTFMAAQSIAYRRAILRLVPKALWVDGYNAAVETARGTIATLGERRRKVLEAFAKFGIKAADLFQAIGVESEQEIGLDHMVDLGGMWTALKDGEAVDVVLGRAAEGRSGPEPVANPLAEPTTSGSGASAGPTMAATAAAASSASASTVQNGEKIDMARQASGERSGESKPAAAVTQPSTKEPAQASPGGAVSGPSGGEAYLPMALAAIGNSVSATKLREWWKRARPGREAAELSKEQLDQLVAAYEAKLDQLMAA